MIQPVVFKLNSISGTDKWAVLDSGWENNYNIAVPYYGAWVEAETVINDLIKDKIVKWKQDNAYQDTWYVDIVDVDNKKIKVRIQEKRRK